jgi:hypothetical protein
VKIPDVVVARSGPDVLSVPADDVLLLAEVISPGNFRQDRIVEHNDYAEADIPFYLRVDLHDGVDVVQASVYELADGTNREYATVPDGVLRHADLRSMARGR